MNSHHWLVNDLMFMSNIVYQPFCLFSSLLPFYEYEYYYYYYYYYFIACSVELSRFIDVKCWSIQTLLHSLLRSYSCHFPNIGKIKTLRILLFQHIFHSLSLDDVRLSYSCLIVHFSTNPLFLLHSQLCWSSFCMKNIQFHRSLCSFYKFHPHFVAVPLPTHPQQNIHTHTHAHIHLL